MLAASALHFAATAGGFLALTVTTGEPTEHYPRINAYRTFPLSDADRYISLRDADGNEIGILESLTDLAPTRRHCCAPSWSGATSPRPSSRCAP